jgi:hypothetical protein
MQLTGGRAKLAQTALVLKKAWLLCINLVGIAKLNVSAHDLAIPDYTTWSRVKLRDHVAALEGDLDDLLRKIVQMPQGKKSFYRVAKTLAAQEHLFSRFNTRSRYPM